MVLSNWLLKYFERSGIKANAHEYLIKNLQISDFHSKNSGATKVNAQVVFNHPVTSFFWVVQKQSNIDAKDYFNYERTAGRGDDTILSATIKFNGSEREKPRGPLFWRKVQPAIYFERTPRKNIYVYSFAQHPSSWFPSGSVNLSRIDVCSLEVTLPATDANGAAFGAADLSVFAENFNVIRIQGGMAAKKCIYYVGTIIFCPSDASKSIVPVRFVRSYGINHLDSRQVVVASAAA